MKMKLFSSLLLSCTALVASTVTKSTTAGTTISTSTGEKSCLKIEQKLWNMQGCHVSDPNASTVTGLGDYEAYTNFRSCTIKCLTEGGNFEVEATPMDVCDAGLEDTGFPNEG